MRLDGPGTGLPDTRPRVKYSISGERDLGARLPFDIPEASAFTTQLILHSTQGVRGGSKRMDLPRCRLTDVQPQETYFEDEKKTTDSQDLLRRSVNV